MNQPILHLIWVYKFYKSRHTIILLRLNIHLLTYQAWKSATRLVWITLFRIDTQLNLFFYNGVSCHSYPTNACQCPSIQWSAGIHGDGLHGHDSTFHNRCCTKSSRTAYHPIDVGGWSVPFQEYFPTWSSGERGCNLNNKHCIWISPGIKGQITWGYSQGGSWFIQARCQGKSSDIPGQGDYIGTDPPGCIIVSSSQIEFPLGGQSRIDLECSC